MTQVHARALSGSTFLASGEMHFYQTCRRRSRDYRSGRVYISTKRAYTVENVTGKDAVIARQGHRASPWHRHGEGIASGFYIRTV